MWEIIALIILIALILYILNRLSTNSSENQYIENFLADEPAPITLTSNLSNSDNDIMTSIDQINKIITQNTDLLQKILIKVSGSNPTSPLTSQPTSQTPVSSQPTSSQTPLSSQPTSSQTPSSQPTSSQTPLSSQPTSSQPTSSQPTTAQPTATQPTTTQPTTTQPATAQPTTAQPATTQPATAQPQPPQLTPVQTFLGQTSLYNRPVRHPIAEPFQGSINKYSDNHNNHDIINSLSSSIAQLTLKVNNLKKMTPNGTVGQYKIQNLINGLFNNKELIRKINGISQTRGLYGPYIQYGGDSRSMDSSQQNIATSVDDLGPLLINVKNALNTYIRARVPKTGLFRRTNSSPYCIN